MDRMLRGNKTLADDDYLLTCFDDIIIKNPNRTCKKLEFHNSVAKVACIMQLPLTLK